MRRLFGGCGGLVGYAEILEQERLQVRRVTCAGLDACARNLSDDAYADFSAAIADGLRVFRVMQQMAARIPGAEVCVLPGVGHLCQMEAPLAVNPVLVEFLQRRFPL